MWEMGSYTVSSSAQIFGGWIKTLVHFFLNFQFARSSIGINSQDKDQRMTQNLCLSFNRQQSEKLGSDLTRLTIESKKLGLHSNYWVRLNIGFWEEEVKIKVVMMKIHNGNQIANPILVWYDYWAISSKSNHWKARIHHISTLCGTLLSNRIFL